MAVIQISRIQNRRGLLSDLRGVNLAAGEFGWAMDHRRLFIGNGEVAEGAPRPGNTEVLTEHSPLTDKIQYRYLNRRFNPASGTYEPVVNLSWQVPRLLQERLDDRISTRSFGVRGDGGEGPAQVEEETRNLRRALYEVFLRENHELPTLAGTDPSGAFSGPWKVLYIPAGVYVINRPLPLLRKMLLMGDGSGRTVIVLDDLSSRPDLQASGLNFVAGTASYNPEFAPDGSAIDPSDDALLAALADSSEHGFDFNAPAVNDRLSPAIEDIFISGVSFVNLNPDGHVVKLRNCRDVSFSDCEFIGFDHNCSDDPYQGGTWHEVSSGIRPACVRIEGVRGANATLLEKTQRLYFSGCRFTRREDGISSEDDILQVAVRDSLFEFLYNGINLGESLTYGVPVARPTGSPAGYQHGPQNVTVLNSAFHSIRRHSFAVWTPAGGNGTVSCRHDMVGIEFNTMCEPQPVTVTCADRHYVYQYECVFFHNDGAGYGATGNFVVADSFFRPVLKTEDCPSGGLWYNPLTNAVDRIELPTVYNGNAKNLLVLPGVIAIGNTGINVGGVTVTPMSTMGIPLAANKPANAQGRPVELMRDPENGNAIIEMDIDDFTTAIVEYSIRWGSYRRVGSIKLVMNKDLIPEGSDIAAFDHMYHEPYGEIPILVGFVRGSGVDQDKVRITYANPTGTAGMLYLSMRKWLT